MAGGRDFSQKKFDELIVYIATRLGPEAALGRVKLAKLLMHSDFAAFQRLGQSITGATYEKWEHGHLPRELIMTQKDLEATGEVEVEGVNYYGRTLRRVTAHRDPDMREFSEDEFAIVEGALRQYGHESASELSRLAHEQIGWQLAKMHETIPYEVGLFGTDRIPPEVLERLQALDQAS